MCVVQNEIQSISQAVMSESGTWEDRVRLLPRSGKSGITIKKTRENITDQDLVGRYSRGERALGKSI